MFSGGVVALNRRLIAAIPAGIKNSVTASLRRCAIKAQRAEPKADEGPARSVAGRHRNC